jgi:hypothetical protein
MINLVQAQKKIKLNTKYESRLIMLSINAWIKSFSVVSHNFFKNCRFTYKAKRVTYIVLHLVDGK